MRNKFNLKLKNISIGTRITLFYTIVFSLTFVILTVFIMLNMWYYYQGVSKGDISETLSKVEEYIKSGNSLENAEFSDINPNVEVRIFNISKDNRFDIMNRRLSDKPKGFPPPMPKDFEDRRDKFETETIKGVPYMSNRRVVNFDGKNYFIEAYRTNEREHDVLSRFAIVFIITNFLGIIASFWIGRFISKKILNPVSEIAKTAERISINDLSQRICVPNSDDEISNLATTFNDMIERLEISFEKQQQFISDASHELKTPISVIQGYANLIDRWGKSDPDILQESIESIKDETEHMSTLIKKLLFLARSEQNQINVQKKELCLNNVVSEVIKEFSVLDIKGKFNVVESESVNIFGDFSLIKQLIWIFIENAVKYSDKEFIKIDIEISSFEDFAFLKISDNGVGIKKDDIPHIFDRFFRGDKSHNKTIPGNGLGLSIANLIVRQHNGKIDVVSEEGKGTIFTVTFDKI